MFTPEIYQQHDVIFLFNSVMPRNTHKHTHQSRLRCVKTSVECLMHWNVSQSSNAGVWMSRILLRDPEVCFHECRFSETLRGVQSSRIHLRATMMRGLVWKRWRSRDHVEWGASSCQQEYTNIKGVYFQHPLSFYSSRFRNKMRNSLNKLHCFCRQFCKRPRKHS